jgi:bacteriocin biosynthesis cyclodehydratase domain-containing protein
VREGLVCHARSVRTAPLPANRGPTAESLRRPALLPGLVQFRRDATTVQLGLEAPRAVVLAGLTPGHHKLLASLDGSRDREDVHRLAARLGLTRQDVSDLLRLLHRHGLVVDADVVSASEVHSDDERARLAPDLASLALRHGSDATARSVLRRRQRSWVEVRGASRVGSAVATLLAAAGIGRVSVADPLPVGLADVGPTGLLLPDVGGSREVAARERVRTVAPSARATRSTGPATPELVVLAPPTGPDQTLVATWSRRSTPHLLAFVRETTGVVGPLVVPGETCCLFCLDLHRRDLDPGWPVIAAQLGRGPANQACDVGLATLVAAQAALQALAYVDGSDPVVLDGTLETSLSTGLTRRRSWSPHPTCGCRWVPESDRFQPADLAAR